MIHFRQPTREELESQRIQAWVLVAEIERVDREYRTRHPNHKCQDWYTSDELGPNRWFCKHLVAHRDRDKALRQMEAQQIYDIWKSNGAFSEGDRG